MKCTRCDGNITIRDGVGWCDECQYPHHLCGKCGCMIQDRCFTINGTHMCGTCYDASCVKCRFCDAVVVSNGDLPNMGMWHACPRCVRSGLTKTPLQDYHYAVERNRFVIAEKNYVNERLIGLEMEFVSDRKIALSRRFFETELSKYSVIEKDASVDAEIVTSAFPMRKWRKLKQEFQLSLKYINGDVHNGTGLHINVCEPTREVMVTTARLINKIRYLWEVISGREQNNFAVYTDQSDRILSYKYSHCCAKSRFLEFRTFKMSNDINRIYGAMGICEEMLNLGRITRLRYQRPPEYWIGYVARYMKQNLRSDASRELFEKSLKTYKIKGGSILCV